MEAPLTPARSVRSGLAAILGGRNRHQQEVPPAPPEAPAPASLPKPASAELPAVEPAPEQAAPAAEAENPDAIWDFKGSSDQGEQQPVADQKESHDSIVELEGNTEPAEDDTVKSINDALRSLFR